MSEQIWALLTIPGVGDLAVWIDEAELDSERLVEADNLTRMILGPKGEIGFMKMMDKAMIRMSQVAVLARPDPQMRAHLSKVWDAPGQIVPANGADLARFKRLPND